MCGCKYIARVCVLIECSCVCISELCVCLWSPSLCVCKNVHRYMAELDSDFEGLWRNKEVPKVGR